jgi:hypothetical protein
LDSQKIIECLKQGIVLIDFRSLKSGNVYSREYTLNENYMNLPNIVKNQSGDKIICYDIDFGKWEDIDVQSIESWKTIQKL